MKNDDSRRIKRWMLVILLLVAIFIAIDAPIVIHIVHIEIEIVELNSLVNIPTVAPVARRLELVQLHELLDCQCWSIILP